MASVMAQVEAVIAHNRKQEEIRTKGQKVIDLALIYARASKRACGGCEYSKYGRANLTDGYPCSWPCGSKQLEAEAAQRLCEAAEELEAASG